MKIVKRPEFLEMPPGTVFRKYGPMNFGDLMIKGATIVPPRGGVSDFYCASTDTIECGGSDQLCDRMEDAEKTGTSYPMDFNTEGRDGMYDEDSQLFAVWEASDVLNLIRRLQECLVGDGAPECNCGGRSGTHRVGVTGCNRKMAEAPQRVTQSPGRPNTDWLVPGVGPVSEFTLRQQWGYHQHVCGRWSRFATDDDSPY